jgi:two-component system, OmpR family, response regulator
MSATEHILVVDDNDDVRDVIVEILRGYGYRVSWAVDGASMREFLQGSDFVDAVILDALMPGESGTTLAAHAKALGLPLVMISGSLDALDLAAQNNLQVLKKPFRARELLDALVRAMALADKNRSPQR